MRRMYFDGGSAPSNPGRMHVCVMLDNEPHFKRLGWGTNNVAEWTALCWGMTLAHAKGVTDLDVYGDSQLIINQANGLWKIREPRFNVFKKEYDDHVKKFHTIRLRYKPRAENLAGVYIEGVLQGNQQTRQIVK
jgi:ribonuclease HI